jgi:hypothetical protein
MPRGYACLPPVPGSPRPVAALFCFSEWSPSAPSLWTEAPLACAQERARWGNTRSHESPRPRVAADKQKGTPPPLHAPRGRVRVAQQQATRTQHALSPRRRLETGFQCQAPAVVGWLTGQTSRSLPSEAPGHDGGDRHGNAFGHVLWFRHAKTCAELLRYCRRCHGNELASGSRSRRRRGVKLPRAAASAARDCERTPRSGGQSAGGRVQGRRAGPE